MSGGSRLWTFEQWWKVIPMRHKAIFLLAVSVPVGLALFIGPELSTEEQGNAQAQTSKKALSGNDRRISVHAQRMIEEGRRIFRFDTFGAGPVSGHPGVLELSMAV